MENLASGPVVTIIGIGSVFCALLILMGVLNVVRRLVEGPQVKAETSSPEMSSPEALAPTAKRDTEEGDTLELLTQIGLAAYGLHRNRRVTVRGPQAQLSAWALAARTQQRQQ